MKLLNGKEVIAKPNKEKDTEYAHVYVFWNADKIVGFHIKLLGKSYGKNRDPRIYYSGGVLSEKGI